MADDTGLTHLSVRELLRRLASREPIPGGGSAAALAGAMGAALVDMVAELTLGRLDGSEQEEAIREIGAAAAERRRLLLELAEEDAAAYRAVVDARRLPKETDADRTHRSATMHAAMSAAAEVPLRTARVATEVLELAQRIAPIGNPNAISDAGVAGLLAGTAVRGAALNVRINLPYLAADDALRITAPEELERIQASAESAERQTLDVVASRMAPS
jgi:formiminotetrahydrofolate cyclodeaminase